MKTTVDERQVIFVIRSSEDLKLDVASVPQKHLQMLDPAYVVQSKSCFMNKLMISTISCGGWEVQCWGTKSGEGLLLGGDYLQSPEAVQDIKQQWGWVCSVFTVKIFLYTNMGAGAGRDEGISGTTCRRWSCLLSKGLSHTDRKELPGRLRWGTTPERDGPNWTRRDMERQQVRTAGPNGTKTGGVSERRQGSPTWQAPPSLFKRHESAGPCPSGLHHLASSLYNSVIFYRFSSNGIGIIILFLISYSQNCPFSTYFKPCHNLVFHDALTCANVASIHLFWNTFRAPTWEKYQYGRHIKPYWSLRHWDYPRGSNPAIYLNVLGLPSFHESWNEAPCDLYLR